MPKTNKDTRNIWITDWRQLINDNYHRVPACLQLFTDCSKHVKKSRKKAKQEQKNLDTIWGLCYDIGEFKVEYPSDIHYVQ